MPGETQRPDADRYSTLSIQVGVKNRLESLKPYQSMSWNEFAEELADVYEGHQG